ncbi:diaminopimelate epimerase [Denitrificimonas sp. JX-1]|uniref:Diaminopimelate epimerase n=1 Tax=Denitrificimonas halotolerans TaxID=3098930 RepID=A0ABU5GN84_9GAMM|nr:diaminopimelate epimerase [Denitrificimonas sp. JX-1]MDY7218309.1 diaminopimelate epimerase [Denitrificimonas sp. JX-1]
MLLRFSKMHGLGNDLMVLDLISQHAYIQPQKMREWSDRRFGVGFRRLALIEVPRHPDVDFGCRMFDQDGVEVDCLASDLCLVVRLVADKRLISKAQMRVEVRGVVLDVQLHVDGSVTVPLATPKLEAEVTTLPASFTQLHQGSGWLLEIALLILLQASRHAVLRVADLARVPMAQLAGLLEQQAKFAVGDLVSVVQVQNHGQLNVRTWQLGRGELDSYHEGLSGIAVASVTQGWTDECLQVGFAKGSANAVLEWRNKDQHVYFTGASTRVYEGQIRL